MVRSQLLFVGKLKFEMTSKVISRDLNIFLEYPCPHIVDCEMERNTRTMKHQRHEAQHSYVFTARNLAPRYTGPVEETLTKEQFAFRIGYFAC
jgi:hypothetical protein